MKKALLILLFGLTISSFALITLAEEDAKPKADDEKAARDAAEAWLKLVDDGKYDESWDAASESFQKLITKKLWADAGKLVREPLGELKSRKFKSAESKTSLPGVPDGHYVVLQYDSTFEKKRFAVETITPMLDKDGKWHVSGYYIR